MVEVVDDVKCPYEGVRLIRAVTVPRFAAEQTEDGWIFDPMPDASNAQLEELEDEGEYPEGEYPEGVDPEDDSVLLQNAQRYRGSGMNSIMGDTEVRPMTVLHHMEESEYNEQGYLVERRTMDNGELVQRERFSYDDRNRLIRKVIEDPINENIEKEERTYDDHDRPLKRTIFYADGTTRVTDHLWKEEGLLEEAITRSPDGVEEHYVRRHDDRGHTVELTEYDIDGGDATVSYSVYDGDNLTEYGAVIHGKRMPAERYGYDEHGHLEIHELLDEKGRVVERHQYAYEGERCVEEEVTDRRGVTSITNEHDENGHLTRSYGRSPLGVDEYVAVYYNEKLPEIEAHRTLSESSSYGSYGHSTTTWWSYELTDTDPSQRG